MNKKDAPPIMMVRGAFEFMESKDAHHVHTAGRLLQRYVRGIRPKTQRPGRPNMESRNAERFLDP